MASEDQNSANSRRLSQIFDPLSRLTELTRSSHSTPSSPRLLPRRPRESGSVPPLDALDSGPSSGNINWQERCLELQLELHRSRTQATRTRDMLREKMSLTLLTGNLLLDLLGVIIAISAVTIAYFKWKFSYWEKRGVATINPKIPFGNIGKLLLGKAAFGETFKDLYDEFQRNKVKYGGIYAMAKPEFMPVDLELIKNIVQKDFQYFMSHGSGADEENDPLQAHLFSLEGQKWRNLRVKLTPTFTSGKMKMMFQTMADCTVGLKSIMDECADNKTPADIKDILARFTTDIIGSVAFGLECNSLKDPNAEFRMYGRRIFELEKLRDRMSLIARFVLPMKLLQFFGIKVTKPDVEKFFMDVVRKTVDYREKNNTLRKDFMQMLIQLKNRGAVTDDYHLTDDGTVQEKALTFNELAAQCYVFFIAGFETSSTTMTFALYELATNPDIQEKLRQEINKVLETHDNKITYDAMMQMEYMDKVIDETLRKYPPVPMLPRKCTKDYNIPGTSIIIEEGTNVRISVLGIHHDEKYYPNPEKFDPERFSEENKAKRPHFAFIPFGEGPRICIGLRFGVLQAKVGLTTLLRNYKITLSKKTQQPSHFEKKGFILGIEGGVWIDVAKIN